MLNANIPRFECWVRDRFLYDLDDRKTMTKAVAFGVSSIPGRALGFHVLLQNGAQVGRLPVSSLALSPDAEELPAHLLELWNAFSYDVSVIEYDFLEGMRCQVTLRDGRTFAGSYMFTVDWHGSADAEDVGDTGWKCGHVIGLDVGAVAIQPNNRIRWAEPSFTTLDGPWPPPYRTVDYIMRCEQMGRWAIEDDLMFFQTRER